MNLMENYWNHVADLLQKVCSTQRENIEKAGMMIADCIDKGGCVHLGHIVHGIEMDLIGRGGGPAFYKAFDYNLVVNDAVRKRDRSSIDTSIEGQAAYALKASNVCPGDVLIVSSVSGRTLKVVDLAYEAKKMGVTVIALSSMEYASQVDAVHSSGKKLSEMVDLTLDNCAPAAEAMIEVEGLEPHFAAASGISSDFIMWSVTSVAVEELMKRGKTPGIYKSANFPGGADYNKNFVNPQYEEKGY